MDSHYLKSIEDYFNIIVRKYRALQKAGAPIFPLRIIKKESSTNGVIFTLQIVGKNLVFKLYETELTNDKQLLKGLSPFDLLKLLKFTSKKTLYKKDNVLIFPCEVNYKLIAKNFDRITKQTVFTLEVSQGNKITQKKVSALEIVTNPLILDKLSPQEIYDLGFTVGSETILREMYKLAHLKNNPI